MGYVKWWKVKGKMAALAGCAILTLMQMLALLGIYCVLCVIYPIAKIDANISLGISVILAVYLVLFMLIVALIELTLYWKVERDYMKLKVELNGLCRVSEWDPDRHYIWVEVKGKDEKYFLGKYDTMIKSLEEEIRASEQGGRGLELLKYCGITGGIALMAILITAFISHTSMGIIPISLAVVDIIGMMRIMLKEKDEELSEKTKEIIENHKYNLADAFVEKWINIEYRGKDARKPEIIDLPKDELQELKKSYIIPTVIDYIPMNCVNRVNAHYYTIDYDRYNNQDEQHY